MINELTIGYPFKPLSGCFGFSSSILVNKNKKILFDVGGYNIRSVIIPLINEIDAVVISHLHFDHCSNLDLFINTNIPIYISKRELYYYSQSANEDIDLFSYFRFIKDKLNIIEVEDYIELDDEIKIIFTPGHTPGHISLSIDNHILLAGDALKTYKDYKDINSYGNAHNKEDYINTKKYIIDNFNTIYPGHSGKIVNGKLDKVMEVKEF